MQRDRRLVPLQPDGFGVHRTGITVAERVRGILQRQTPRRTPGDRDVPLPTGSEGHGRGLPPPLQHLPAPLLARLPHAERVHARLQQHQPQSRKDTGPLNGGRSPVQPPAAALDPGNAVTTRIRNTAHRRRKSGMITKSKLSGLPGQAPLQLTWASETRPCGGETVGRAWAGVTRQRSGRWRRR